MIEGMTLQECTDKTAWEKESLSAGNREFLQSWEWGEFQRAAGREPLRLQWIENGKVRARAQGFAHPLAAGFQFAYFPRANFDVPDFAEKVFAFLKERNFVFARIEPQNGLHVCRSMHPVRSRQPRHTLVLSLEKSEDELLAGMHGKTRYNIRLSERKGVDIREGKDEEIFWRLHSETIARDKFSGHPRRYYSAMLACPLVFQLTAWFQGRPLSSNIYIAYNGRCTYLHGASGNEHRDVMSPYLLQWRGIQLAKNCGCVEYDFWGVAGPAGRAGKSDKLSGVTRFKAGFGGSAVSYPEAAEAPLRPLIYYMYATARRLRNRE